MNFSDYLKILFPKIGGEKSKADFAIDLINHIMDPTIEQDNQKDTKDEYNPLSRKKDDTLYKIFNGRNNLAARDAREIFSHLNKKEFEKYLSKFPDDVIDLIGESLQNKGVEVPENETIDVCIELLVKILGDCAENKNKNKKPQIENVHKNTLETTPKNSSTHRSIPAGIAWGSCGSPAVRVNCGLRSDDVVWGSCGSQASARRSCNLLSSDAVISGPC